MAEEIAPVITDPPPAVMLFGDVIDHDHDRSISLSDGPNINPLAAPALKGSDYTVTVVSPTPPTNIADVACGSPPHFSSTYDSAQVHNNTKASPYVTFTDDLALFAAAGAPGSLLVIATPIAGSSGPTAEATGTVVIVTAPGSRTECPTQMISVQGAFTSFPNQSHPSYGGQTITSLSPNPTPSGAGTIALTVNGTKFTAASVVYVDGVAQTSAVINPNLITVAAAPKRTTAGTSTVAVVTSGAVSNVVVWTFS